MEAKTDYMRNSPRSHLVGLRKQISCVYYPPDGSGRDYYVAEDHGGTCVRQKNSRIDFMNCNYLRGQVQTPIMD